MANQKCEDCIDNYKLGKSCKTCGKKHKNFQPKQAKPEATLEEKIKVILSSIVTEVDEGTCSICHNYNQWSDDKGIDCSESESEWLSEGSGCPQSIQFRENLTKKIFNAIRKAGFVQLDPDQTLPDSEGKMHFTSEQFVTEFSWGWKQCEKEMLKAKFRKVIITPKEGGNG